VKRSWGAKNIALKSPSDVENLVLISQKFLPKPKTIITSGLFLPKKPRNKIFMKKP
jgi:hypothetical protein